MLGLVGPASVRQDDEEGAIARCVEEKKVVVRSVIAG